MFADDIISSVGGKNYAGIVDIMNNELESLKKNWTKLNASKTKYCEEAKQILTDF